MTGRRFLKIAGKGLAVGTGLAAIGYAVLVAFNYLRYGKTKAAPGEGEGRLLARFLPQPEVAEHHYIEIDAPAEAVMATAKQMELLHSPLIRALFKARALVLGGGGDDRTRPTELLPQMQSIGWVVLAETAGREIVFGAVTQPWLAAPVFRSIPAADFAAFSEPGYVKIAWTLRADPVDAHRSVFHTETRVSTTDEESRARFRRYWAFAAPGVELIRLAMLRPLKRAAERRERKAAA